MFDKRKNNQNAKYERLTLIYNILIVVSLHIWDGSDFYVPHFLAKDSTHHYYCGILVDL